MTEVIVVNGPGQIGKAIARRIGIGKHVLLADRRQDHDERMPKYSRKGRVYFCLSKRSGF